MAASVPTDKVKDKEYSNWLKVTLALYYMKSGLHTFIQSEVDCLHKLLVQKIYGSKLVSPTHCTTCDASCVRRNKQSRVWTFQKRCNLCCSNWFDELSNLHTNPNSDKIFWDNSNVTLWPFSPWECAKVFMPRGQLPSNVGPDECDAQALLTLLTSCKHFHHKLSSQGLRLTSTISTIRNKVIHNGEMKLSDADRRAYIQQIIQLLEDPKSLNSLEDCKAAVGNIQKIDNDSVDVFFNVEQQMIALQEAVNAVKEDLGLQEKKTLDSVKSLKEEYRHLITKLEAVENGVGTVENSLDTVENRVDTVENRVDTVENWVDTVENRVYTVEKRVDTVENKQDTLENQVDTVVNRVDTFEKRVDTVEKKQDTLENQVDTVANRVDTFENRQNTFENSMDIFENRINTFGSNIQSVMELTTATQHQVVLSQTMSASVTRLEGRVEAVEETLVNLQDTGQWTDETICCRKDIIKLRDDLIKAYENLRCVQVSPIFEKRRCDIENVFVDLVIVDKQGRRNTQGKSKHHTIPCKKALSSIKETNMVTSYKQLFLDERGSKFKRIYLCGKGGLGKTTFCRKVLHAWCNAHEGRAVASGDYFQDEAVLQMFDLLFYMNLREVSVDETLIDFICAQFPLEKAASKIILGNMLKLIGDKILFILDGLDEMIVKGGFIDNVVTRRKYPNCCFLVSSRPWKIFDMELHEKTEIDLLLNVKGFSKKNSMKCAKKIFENCYQDGNVIKQFHEDIARNKLAAQLIHVPLLLLFLTHVWYENKRSLPSKLHELYILFLNLIAIE